MALVEVFSHALYVRYKASICSKAMFYYILSVLITITVPFLIAYLSEGFWRKYEIYREQPHVRFKHHLMLIVETNKADGLLFWSSYSVLNDIMNQNLRYPTITNREVDNNGDGKNDVLNLKIDIPVMDEENVHSVKLLLFFDYRLYIHPAFIMEGLVYIHHSSPLPGAFLSVVGDLSLHQKIPLKHKGKDNTYNVPVINLSGINADDFKLESILLSYANRDEFINDSICLDRPTEKSVVRLHPSFAPENITAVWRKDLIERVSEMGENTSNESFEYFCFIIKVTSFKQSANTKPTITINIPVVKKASKKTDSVTTYLKNSYLVWKTGRGAEQPFSINVTLFYPEETILYKAGFWQLIKWAWVQLCALMVIMVYIFYGVNTFVFRNQLVPTLVENPMTKKWI